MDTSNERALARQPQSHSLAFRRCFRRRRIRRHHACAPVCLAARLSALKKKVNKRIIEYAAVSFGHSKKFNGEIVLT
jgi:hypothetical protein